MYAEADLYGLGKGVFPKDAAPENPAHPHCLCHYAPVYRSELEDKKRSDDVEENGNAWLKKQPVSVQEKILGVKGREEWKAGGAGWMGKARNLNIQIGGYYGIGIKGRLSKLLKKISGEENREYGLEEVPRIKGPVSMEANLKKTNPNYGKHEAYSMNCQKCVPAFELRMRGYDVTAKWYNEKDECTQLLLDPFSAFLDSEIKIAPDGWINAGKTIVNDMKRYGHGSRIEISLLDPEGYGHVIMALNDNGVVKFVDPQTGKYFKLAGENGNIKVKYARIDNAKINLNLLKEMCDWRGKI